MTEHDTDGGGRPRVTTAAAVLAAMEAGEPYSTPEVAELVGVSRRTALRRLDELADDGKVRKKKLDARRAVWLKVT